MNNLLPVPVSLRVMILTLIVVSPGFALTFWVTGCATLSASITPPNLSVVSIEPAEVGPLEQKYHLKVRLQNPNDHALEISGISYVLEVNGQPLLKGVSSDRVTLPRFGESIIELSGVSTLFGFLRQLQALEDKKPLGMHYRIRGKFGLANRLGSLPFSYEGTLLPPAAGDAGS
ncbi:LEA14-like dessication related protein [Thiogranum longum]|uniref:LEA14-like dessication related protein n=1 Tax=Thiogranum longum TaxID=1537524 RepID=A0A4R1HDD7_9GAMM|nr:LEA type 2 family protein [Thiogranum longum]TCK18633.1 LEA14-like dessication related protein [Thiogranum longum]